MKYFLHDSNAFNDEKITELYIKFGYEGLGLFYTILEKLAQQEKPIKTDILKRQLDVGKRLEKCWSFMEEIGIISSRNGDTFNINLLNFSEKYLIKKQKNRERIAKWRENTADVTCYESVRNTRKYNISKVNRSKYNKGTFVPPSIDDISAYIKEMGYGLDPQDFLDKNEAAGWKMNGGKKVSDWKAHIRSWETRRKKWETPKDKFIAFEEMLCEHLKPDAPPNVWMWNGMSLWRVKMLINELYPENMGLATPADIKLMNDAITNQDKIKKHLINSYEPA